MIILVLAWFKRGDRSLLSEREDKRIFRVIRFNLVLLLKILHDLHVWNLSRRTVVSDNKLRQTCWDKKSGMKFSETIYCPVYDTESQSGAHRTIATDYI